MSVSKGAVMMVGTLAGIPAGDWALAYGLVTDICENSCCAVVNVGDVDVVVNLKEHAPSEDVPMSWEGKSIAKMTETERATFHTVWSNHWIPVQYFNPSTGEWVTPKAASRNKSYDTLKPTLKRRIKPSEAVERREFTHKRREEIAEQIRVLAEEDAILVASLLS